MPPPLVSRKFMYPEQSVPYESYLKPKSSEEIYRELKDNQFAVAPRSTYFKVGAVSSAAGSAYMEYGNTKVLVAVQPLRELDQQVVEEEPLGVITCLVKYAPFAVSDQATLNRKRTFMSAALKKSLEPMACRQEFSNFELVLNVLVLDDDGCALSTAINCCGIALINAGIPVYDMIAASTVGIYKDTAFVNPNSEVELLTSLCANEMDDEYGTVVVSGLFQMDQISETFFKGYVTQETMDKLLDYNIQLNKIMHGIISTELRKKVRERLQKGKETNVI